MAISYQTPDPSVKPWDSSRLGWLVLTSFPAFGSRTHAKLHKLTNGDGGAALNISHDFIVAMGHTEKIADRFLAYRNQTSATQLAERLDREQIQFVLRGDPEYPPLLEQSADPPQALFLRGETSALSRKSVALVGTRAATSYGRFVTAELGHALARSGFSVVSGLALGIDSAAHEATLDADGTCVAVLGTGVNDRSIYPRTNAKLATRIMENGGAILSEFPPGTEGHKHHFPLRNRIIAALATTVVIIEADEKSGSLITAKLALDENRDVYAVPGPITSPRSRGTNLLISQGAIPCLGAEHLIDALSPATIGRRKRSFDDPPPDLTENERRLWNLLIEPLSRDDLGRSLKLSAAEITGLLTSLELKNGIMKEPGGRICRAGHG